MTIGSDDNDTIVVHDNEHVVGGHVTLTNVDDHVRLETDSEVQICLAYKADNTTINAIVGGRVELPKDFKFSLYPGNESELDKRYIDFQVTLDRSGRWQ